MLSSTNFSAIYCWVLPFHFMPQALRRDHWQAPVGSLTVPALHFPQTSVKRCSQAAACRLPVPRVATLRAAWRPKISPVSKGVLRAALNVQNTGEGLVLS